MSFIKKLWNSSPASIYKAILKKTIYGNDYNYSPKAVIADGKHMNTCMLIDRWERYNRVLKKNKIIDALEVKEKSIFELGCGPLLGWGPIFIFFGAKNFYFFEPHFNYGILDAPEIKKNYFKQLYIELVANYGKKMHFHEFMELLKNQVREIDFNKDENIDIILSNSVLEHIPKIEVESTIKKLSQISNQNSVSIHSVDHSPHNKYENDLMNFYNFSKFKTYHALNLLRKNEIKEILINKGFKNTIDYVYRKQDLQLDKIHNSWINYNKEDLEAKVVFYYCKKH
tara:strand:+ start:114 stop:965 length:852 start_codon:yes stop_codon:yes gene_type:complete